MAAGLPVVASNCSGNVDVVQDGVNGRLFPVGDINALVLLIKELVADTEQCKKLVRNAINLSDSFGLDEINCLWDDVVGQKYCR